MTEPGEPKNPIDRRVGAAILRRRRQLRLTLAQLAQAAQIAVATLSDYEAGRRRAQAEHLCRIADVLDVPPAYFFRPGGADDAFD